VGGGRGVLSLSPSLPPSLPPSRSLPPILPLWLPRSCCGGGEAGAHSECAALWHVSHSSRRDPARFLAGTWPVACEHVTLGEGLIEGGAGRGRGRAAEAGGRQGLGGCSLALRQCMRCQCLSVSACVCVCLSLSLSVCLCVDVCVPCREQPPEAEQRASMCVWGGGATESSAVFGQAERGLLAGHPLPCLILSLHSASRSEVSRADSSC